MFSRRDIFDLECAIRGVPTCACEAGLSAQELVCGIFGR